MREGWKKYWGWAAIFFALAGLHLTTVSREFGGNLGGDNIVYYLLGKALAAGQGYVDLYLPGHPPHTKYPFVFPLLLAPFHWLFTNPLPAMHAMVALANVAAAMALGAWAGQRLGSPRTGLFLALVFGTIPKIYLQSLHLLTEPVYMALCFLALLVFPEEKNVELPARRFALLTLLGLTAYFTRTAGVALVAALVLGGVRFRASVRLGQRKLPAWALLAAVFGACALAWFLRNRLAATESAVYVSQFLAKDPYRLDLGRAGLGDFGHRILDNLKYYFPRLGAYALTPSWVINLPALVAAVVGYAVLGLVAVGLAREIRNGRLLAEIFFLAGLCITLLWPYQEERFLAPILPLAAYYVISGARGIAEKVASPLSGRRILTGLIAAIILSQIYSLAGLVSDRFVDGRLPTSPVYVSGFGNWDQPVVNWSNYDAVFRGGSRAQRDELVGYTNYFIINRAAGAVAPSSAIILSRKPMQTYFYSGRASVPILSDPRPEPQWQYIVERRVDYIVLGLEEDALKPLFKMWPARFKLAADIAGSQAVLLKVVRDAPAASPAAKPN